METKSRAQKILEKFKKAQNVRSLKDPKWKELDAFDRGEQWDISSSKLPAWFPRNVTNFIHLVKYMKRASLAVENPMPKLRPQHPNDIGNVKTLNDALIYEWEKMKARKVTRACIETSKLLGTGIAQVYYDTSEGVQGKKHLYEGQIKVTEIDPSSFYPDPTAHRLEDCQFIHIVERKPIEWLKNHPRFKDKMKDVQETNLSDREQGYIYERDYMGLQDSKDGMIDFRSHYEKIAKPEGGFRYSVTYLAGEKELLHIEEILPNRYPFAVLYDFPQRKDFWAKSTCEIILDNQKIINKVEAIITMLGTLTQNPQRVVFKQSGINPREVKDFGLDPGHTWVSNVPPDKAMSYAPVPQIPLVLLTLADTAKQNIREVTGLTEAYMGQTVGSLQTSQGVNALIDRATLRDRDQMYDVELFLQDLCSIILDFMLTHYTEPRLYFAIDGKTEFNLNPDDFKEFIAQDYEDVEYSVHIDISGSAPISRMRQKEEAREFLEIRAQYNPDQDALIDYVEQSEFINKNEIIKRLEMEKLEAQTAQAMEIAEAMFMMLQQGMPPEEVYAQGQAMFEEVNQAQQQA